MKRPRQSRRRRSRRSMSLAMVHSRSTLCGMSPALIAMSWCGNSTPTGRADQLNCNQLDIHFAPKAAPPDAKARAVVVDPSKRQQRDLGRLEPAAIVALGHPAIAVSPSRKVEARGERIQIALARAAAADRRRQRHAAHERAQCACRRR